MSGQVEGGLEHQIIAQNAEAKEYLLAQLANLKTPKYMAFSWAPFIVNSKKYFP